MKQTILFPSDLQQTLQQEIAACHPDKLFILTDENTLRLCWPQVEEVECLKGAQVITIAAGDVHKNLDSLSQVWIGLQQGGATRHSLLICLGGGMVTDLGGFAASTFKRGIAFVNIPTTLLAMVDASVGGKTGINFNNLKNEVGVFSNAKAVIISPQFLQTLDRENLLSGYAEMVKHGLISTKAHWAEVMQLPEPTAQLIKDSIAVKEQIVEADPHEQGLRKALNLGHTVGHAIEEWSHETILHGYAVAYGLVCELYLSVMKCGFPTDRLHQTVQLIRENYGRPDITCDDYPELISLMKHDKKNTSGTINFTLLADIGVLRLNQTASEEEIKEALDFLREG